MSKTSTQAPSSGWLYLLTENSCLLSDSSLKIINLWKINIAWVLPTFKESWGYWHNFWITMKSNETRQNDLERRQNVWVAQNIHCCCWKLIQNVYMYVPVKADPLQSLLVAHTPFNHHFLNEFRIKWNWLQI